MSGMLVGLAEAGFRFFLSFSVGTRSGKDFKCCLLLKVYGWDFIQHTLATNKRML